MQEEYFDIVDESDNITGEKKLRSIVHSSGDWHRSVHIYFYRFQNKAIEFLIHLRAKTKDLYPNRWDTKLGGHLKVGETWNKAAKREINEEIGLKVKIKNLSEGEKVKNTKSLLNREINKIYYYNFDRNINDLKFDDGEVQEVKWMAVSDIKNGIKNHSDKWAPSIEEFIRVSDFLISEQNKFNSDILLELKCLK
ncbi:NUDIX domain-containing protein [Patescibacteria group bacterium]|nr:NUDIX domain-containing protein [Patescibacteria group bacterium]MBU4580635.1 NUDIX domain-containing protein [Patescibacteria group bacterium]